MNKQFKFLRLFFRTYILSFFVIFSIYSIPFIFLAILGVFYILENHYWIIFFSSVFGVFILLFSSLLIFRYSRIPRSTTSAQVNEAHQIADRYISTFDYSKFHLTKIRPNSKIFLRSCIDLNRRIANACGLNHAHPEYNLSLGELIQLLISFSNDLYDYSNSKIIFRKARNYFTPAGLLKMYFFVNRTVQKVSGFFSWLFPKNEQTSPTPDDRSLPDLSDDNSPECEPDSEAKPSLLSYLNPLTHAKKQIFKPIFDIVAKYSIDLNSKKIGSNRRYISYRNYSSWRQFLSTRLLLWPIVMLIFCTILFLGLVISGLFYSTDTVWELVQICKNSKTNGLTSFSTLPWSQINLRLLPGAAALIFSSFIYLIPLFFRFHLSPYKIQPNPQWSEKEKEIFIKTQEVFIDGLDVSSLRSPSTFVKNIWNLLLFTDSSYREEAGSGKLKYKDPEYPVPLQSPMSEILEVQKTLISRLQSVVNEEFPFINYLTINDILFATWLYKVYMKCFIAFRGVNCFINPISGTVAEMRIRMNRSILKLFLEEFLISGEIYFLDLINYHYIEIYSGFLQYSPKPFTIFVTGGTEEQRQSVCNALPENVTIQMDSAHGGNGIWQWILPWKNSSRRKKMMEQQSDLILCLDMKAADSEEKDAFQIDSSEMPLVVWVTPVSESPLPCSEDFCSVPWKEDDESVFLESIQNVLSQNQERLRSRQTFRFVRDFEQTHGR